MSEGVLPSKRPPAYLNTRIRPVSRTAPGACNGSSPTDELPMHIHEWPAGERPREKLLSQGAGALSDAELLAIFLGSGTRGQDAVATARTLLAAHGPLRALLE